MYAGKYMYDFLEEIVYNASEGDSAKEIVKNIKQYHSDMASYFGDRELVDFVVHLVGAIDVGQGLKIAQKHEKQMYKLWPTIKSDINDFLDDFTDMELEGEGTEFPQFWKRS